MDRIVHFSIPNWNQILALQNLLLRINKLSENLYGINWSVIRPFTTNCMAHAMYPIPLMLLGKCAVRFWIMPHPVQGYPFGQGHWLHSVALEFLQLKSEVLGKNKQFIRKSVWPQWYGSYHPTYAPSWVDAPRRILGLTQSRKIPQSRGIHVFSGIGYSVWWYLCIKSKVFGSSAGLIMMFDTNYLIQMYC